MNLEQKIQILAASAKYDVSCASSGTSTKRNSNTGSCSSAGICHSWSEDGRCISLLKILLSNKCIYDCAYCVNRRSNDQPRTTFTVEEIVGLTMDFYRRNYIEGLFLSSGIVGSPDETMSRMVEVVRRLRMAYGFGGYVHLKAIPGASRALIDSAGLLADRVSVNIELPSSESLSKLAPQKAKDQILLPMGRIADSIAENRQERKKYRGRAGMPLYAPAGQSTQMIIGASPESDRHIISLSKSLYSAYSLKRVYYSAYAPVNSDSRLPPLESPPLLREHRLYQADWLLRLYGFECDEILPSDCPNLDPELDPKCAWALRNPQFFPVDINSASYEELLRVPGIGLSSAKRIIMARKSSFFDEKFFEKTGATLRKALNFVSFSGRIPSKLLAPDFLRAYLSSKRDKRLANNSLQGELDLAV